ncbi:hypothetical protein [Nonomuraea sp. NPDC002799]
MDSRPDSVAHRVVAFVADLIGDRGDDHEAASVLGVESARKGEASPRVMALMLVREAWTTALRAGPAKTPDPHTATRIERLIGEAEQAYAHGRTDRDPHWIENYDEPELGAEIGTTCNLLGAYDRGAANAEHAVREFAVSRPRSAQLNRLAAADAYLGGRELEQALHSVRSAVPVAADLASARLVESIRQFDRRLRPYEGTVQVREFRAYLHQQLAS